MSSKSVRLAFLQGTDSALESRRARLARFIALAFSHTRARLVVGCFALLLVSSYLMLGGTGDDDFHAVALQSQPTVPGVERAPWDLFSFATVEHNPTLMESGVFPWWTDPELVIAFYRPLSSLTMWVDSVLWPHNRSLMHLHSMLWFALLLAAVGATFRELSLSPKHAALALFLYAVDDARSMPVAWLAQRNALISMAPAVLTLLFHHRFRSGGSKWLGLMAPLCLAVAFQGGESALSICAYLFAYALIMDPGSLRSRLLSLAPYVTVVIAWRALYTYLGRGALHSGIYIDPGRDPVEFARHLFERLPILLLGQIGLPFADLWEAYPLITWWLQPAVLAFALGVLGLAFYLFRPLLREHRLLRFWLLGALLATVPVCGVHPEDRMLTATGIGITQVLAAFLWALVDGTYAQATRFTYACGGLLAAVHVVFAPLTLPLRSFDIYAMERVMLHADKTLPQGDEAKGKTLVLVNPPLNVFAIYFPVFRGARNWTLPEHFRWLATGEADLEVKRVDERSLSITPKGGFLSTSSQVMFRRADRKFALNDEVRLNGIVYKIASLTADGRPSELLVQFDEPLESPRFAWRVWGRHEYLPFTPPAVGKSVVLPKADLGALWQDPHSAS
jgi:hypothetical protein